MNKRTRWQLPKFSMSGRAYLTHYGTRIYLDEVMRTESDTDNSIVGVRGISNCSSYVIRAKQDYSDEKFSVSISVIG